MTVDHKTLDAEPIDVSKKESRYWKHHISF